MGALLGKGSFGAVFNAKWTQHSGQQMSGRTSVCGVWCVMRDVWCVARGVWCVLYVIPCFILLRCVAGLRVAYNFV